MGRPLNKRNFGTSTINGEIEVIFWDSVGGAPTTGWIIAQKGTKKFRVTDGSVEETCFLKWDAAIATVADLGKMTIGLTDDAGAAQLVRKISGHKATLGTGEVVGWLFTANVADDDRGTIDESDGFAADAIPVADATDGLLYMIIEPGTTDFTLIGAANSNAGTTFTKAAAAEVSDGSFVIGVEYEITTVGSTTDWTEVGAIAGTLGEIFTATAVTSTTPDGGATPTIGDGTVGFYTP